MNIELESFLKGKVFRMRENIKKIKFIIENSDITLPFIVRAASISRGNPYHNFGHQIGVAEYAIRLAIAENRSRNEINTVGTGSLVHDAKHNGVLDSFDEINALEAAVQFMDDDDFKIIHLDIEKSIAILRDLIMSTIFGNRAKIEDPLAKIIQDADLAHLGQVVIYWLWASMGLIEEFSKQRKVPLTPTDFIKIEQENFVEFLSKLSPSGTVYLSRGANKIFRNPLQDVQVIKNLPDAAIMFAYNVRHDDITLEEFEAQITPLMSA